MTYEEQQEKVNQIREALLNYGIEVGEHSQVRWKYEFSQTEEYQSPLEIIVSWSMNKYRVSLCAGMSRLVDPISRSLEEITDVNSFAQEVSQAVVELQNRVQIFNPLF